MKKYLFLAILLLVLAGFALYKLLTPPAPDPYSLQVGDVNDDGRIDFSDLTDIIDITSGAFANYDVMQRADVNYDKTVNIADVITLVDVLLGGELHRPVKEGYDYVWDDDTLPEVHIDVSLSEWNKLLGYYDAKNRTTKYVMASLTFVKDGETTVIDSVGLRLKGNSTRQRPEGSSGQIHQRDNTDWHHTQFSINLRKYVKDKAHTIQGVRKIHLKWIKNDPTYVREMFCYELFRRAGVWTAIRDNYCRLWIHVEGDSKEAYYGVYELLEPIDKRYLKDRKALFGNDKGFLWKCRFATSSLTNPDGDIWYDDGEDKRHAYTLKTRTEAFDTARLQLIDFMNKIMNLSDNEFYTWIQQVTDVDLLLKTYAVNVAVGMWDDYWNHANNYYLYFNDTGLTGYKFFFIPYDYDLTLGIYSNQKIGNLTDPVCQDPLHWGLDSNPLIARILKFDDYKAIYIKHLKFLVTPGNAMMDRQAAQERILKWQSKIADYIDNDTGEETVLEDKLASWCKYRKYNLLQNDSDNFFTVKAAIINALK